MRTSVWGGAPPAPPPPTCVFNLIRWYDQYFFIFCILVNLFVCNINTLNTREAKANKDETVNVVLGSNLPIARRRPNTMTNIWYTTILIFIHLFIFLFKSWCSGMRREYLWQNRNELNALCVTFRRVVFVDSLFIRIILMIICVYICVIIKCIWYRSLYVIC